MKHDVLVLMCVAALFCTSAMADPPSYTLNKEPPYRYDFQLEKGAGTPVCDAYLKRLRNTDFYRIPHCDRPENTSVPGFSAIKRVPLTEQETLALYEPLEGFLFYGDINKFPQRRAEQAKLGIKTDGDSARLAAEDQVRLSSHGYADHGSMPLPPYFRLDSVDVDNDGHSDRVVVWKQTSAVCGQQYLPSFAPRASETYLVSLDSRDQIDIARTDALLGPARKMGRTFGVFVFNGEHYLDSFVPPTGALEKAYQTGKTASDVLDVYHRKNGVTAAACEIRWYDRPQQR